MTHCHREIYDAQWDIILDAEFLVAYAHGIVVLCCDGVWRRFYPRIFTYSADYREKCAIPYLNSSSFTNIVITEFSLLVFVT